MTSAADDLIHRLWEEDYREGVPFAGPRCWANIEAQRVLPMWRAWRLPWAVSHIVTSASQPTPPA